VKRLVADLNHLYRREPALHQVDFESHGFEWIDCMNSNDSSLAFIRRARDANDYCVVCCNFTPVVRRDYRVGMPQGGSYHEIFNSDSHHYGGGNVGNYPGLDAEPIEAQGRSFSVSMTLPPLGIVVLKPGG